MVSSAQPELNLPPDIPELAPYAYLARFLTTSQTAASI